MYRIGFVVGLALEARFLRSMLKHVAVEVGAGSVDGVRAAVARLRAAEVNALISFGLAGGLDPSLKAGDILVPDEVMIEGESIRTSGSLRRMLGSGVGTPLLHSREIVSTVQDKARLFRSTGCAATDMESGTAAQAARDAGVPFAVLRAVCDPAGQALPPAAALPISHDGIIRYRGIAASILKEPFQVGRLIELGSSAARARENLRHRLVLIGDLLRSEP